VEYAPFYAARAFLLGGTDIGQAEIDFTRALALDKNEWRYHKLLAEHYIKQQQNEKALALTQSYYRLHGANYIMGMLYAKALLLNKRYAQCDRLLTKLNIIPFEGATEGRELYREAKLMQAVQQLKRKEYKKALQLTTAARNWPENLGVGKPYEQDVDERLEDWMNYRCYEQMANTEAAQASLQKIIRFNPQIENTVRNFIPANHIVTLWALEKTANKQQATDWLNEQLNRYPDNKDLLWVSAVFYDQKNKLPANEKNASIRILEQIERLGQ
jgi:hypothetical protein